MVRARCKDVAAIDNALQLLIDSTGLVSVRSVVRIYNICIRGGHYAHERGRHERNDNIFSYVARGGSSIEPIRMGDPHLEAEG